MQLKTQTLHGTGIFTYIGVVSGINVSIPAWGVVGQTETVELANCLGTIGT